MLGFPDKGEYTPVLQDATYRKIGSASPPEPVPISLDEALAGTHDCKLVRITGKLLEHTRRGREQFIVVEKDGFVFYAYLAQEEGRSGFSTAEVGSEVAVEGICLIQRGSTWRAGESWRAKSFRILLRSPQDVVILRSPPWLNVRRMLWMAGALGFIALAASAWVAVLRRQVAERTRQLEAQIQERQRAERRREIEQERARVAHDLHDDLGAGLTEVNMLSSLVKSSTTSAAEKQRYLDELTRTAERMVTSLDEIVWAVNPQPCPHQLGELRQRCHQSHHHPYRVAAEVLPAAKAVGDAGQKTERLRVIVWAHPANNDFLLVSQFSVTGTRRGTVRKMNEARKSSSTTDKHGGTRIQRVFYLRSHSLRGGSSQTVSSSVFIRVHPRFPSSNCRIHDEKLGAASDHPFNFRASAA